MIALTLALLLCAQDTKPEVKTEAKTEAKSDAQKQRDDLLAGSGDPSLFVHRRGL